LKQFNRGERGIAEKKRGTGGVWRGEPGLVLGRGGKKLGRKKNIRGKTSGGMNQSISTGNRGGKRNI